LRFLVRRKSVFAIAKASDPSHTLENAGAGKLQLSQAEIDEIDHIFALGPEPAELPVL
jgi:diketogulonate reductase-like aldo/keto reductase